MRILFCTGLAAGDELTDMLHLADGLAELGEEPVVLQGWQDTGTGNVERAGERSYPLYRSKSPAADLPTLAMMENPDVAMVFGPEPVAMLQDLRAAQIPAYAWLSGPHPLDLGWMTADRGLALAAASQPLAQRLSLLSGRYVETLPPPLHRTAPVRSGGDAIFFAGDTDAGGLAMLATLAKARPQFRFVVAQPASGRERLNALPNITLPGTQSALPRVRFALLPAVEFLPPWSAVAALLSAGIPFVVGDDRLLAEAVGPAGVSVSLTGGIGAWLATIDRWMTDLPPTVLAACAPQAAALCPPPARATVLCRDALAAHRSACGHFVAGRL